MLKTKLIATLRRSISLSILLIPFFVLTMSRAIGAQVPCTRANAQSNKVSSDCSGCTITNPSNAIDDNTLTGSVLRLNAGSTGYVEQILKFGTVGEIGDSIKLDISFLSNISSIVAGDHVSIATYYYDSYNGDRASVSDSRFDVKISPAVPLPFAQHVFIGFAATKIFNRVEVRIASVSNRRIQQVSIFYANKEPAPAIIDSPPATLCFGNSTTLKANGPVGTVFRWYLQPSGGVAIFTGSVLTTPSLTADLTLYVEASRNGCTSNYRTPVTVKVSSVQQTPTVTSAEICRGQQAVLKATAPFGSTVRWYTSPSGGSHIYTGNIFTTPLLFSDVSYYAEITSRVRCSNPKRAKADVIVYESNEQAFVWSGVYGWHENDELYDGIVTSDHGFLFTGVHPFGWVIKTDSEGQGKWIKTETNYGKLVCSAEAVDGYLVGDESGSFLVRKFDFNGNEVGQFQYPGNNANVISAIVPVSGGYLLAGSTSSNTGGAVTQGTHGALDFWIVRIDAAGNKIWDKTYGGSQRDHLIKAIKTPDGGFLLAGTTVSNDGDVTGTGYHGMEDYLMIKVDANGNKQWSKCFGGSNDESKWDGIGLTYDTDGNFLLTGNTLSRDGDISNPYLEESEYNMHLWMIKVNPAGNKIWDKIIQDNSTGIYNPVSLVGVASTPDAYYLLSSIDDGGNRIRVFKLTYSGNILWEGRFGGPGHDYASSLLKISNSEFLIVGYSGSSGGQIHPNAEQDTGPDGALNGIAIKFRDPVCQGIEVTRFSNASDYLSNSGSEINFAYPNPFNDQINIHSEFLKEEPGLAEIFNSRGEKIKKIEVSSSQSGEIILKTEELESGIYFFRLATKGRIFTQKVVKY